MLSRRNWLRLTGSAGAGLMAGGGLAGAFLEYFRPASTRLAGAQKVATACGVCSPACANTALMHPDLAVRLGVRNGQKVRIRSRMGAIELPAELTERPREDSVTVAHGFGPRSKLLTVAGNKGVRDGDVVPGASIEDFIRLGNYGGFSCIMDAVVNIEPL